MNILYMIVLFILLTPGIIFRYRGNKYIIAAIHALVFTIVYTRVFSMNNINKEHFDGNPGTNIWMIIGIVCGGVVLGVLAGNSTGLAYNPS